MVGAAWADQDTDPEAPDPDLGRAAVEGQAVVLVLVVDLALARPEAAEAPACGSRAGQAVVVARGQELVAQVAESERVVEPVVEPERVVVARVAVDMAAVPGLALVGLLVEVEPAAALVAGRAEVDLEVVGAEGPGSAGE